ncbi:hypothetical protein A0256_14460 [Mucilaginibacter sp. PAMC 26640]|nr:hypothetical protein A0256_14460 [Mucilaginibacter sp. PAMC 26640]
MNNRYSFKQMFWAYTFCAMPFLILAGILSFFNVTPVEFNGTPRYGLQGFFIAVIFIPFTGLILTCTNWLALNFGNFLYSAFLNAIKKR